MNKGERGAEAQSLRGCMISYARKMDSVSDKDELLTTDVALVLALCAIAVLERYDCRMDRNKV